MCGMCSREAITICWAPITSRAIDVSWGDIVLTHCNHPSGSIKSLTKGGCWLWQGWLRLRIGQTSLRLLLLLLCQRLSIGANGCVGRIRRSISSRGCWRCGIILLIGRLRGSKHVRMLERNRWIRSTPNRGSCCRQRSVRHGHGGRSTRRLLRKIVIARY